MDAGLSSLRLGPPITLGKPFVSEIGEGEEREQARRVSTTHMTPLSTMPVPLPGSPSLHKSSLNSLSSPHSSSPAAEVADRAASRRSSTDSLNSAELAIASSPTFPSPPTLAPAPSSASQGTASPSQPFRRSFSPSTPLTFQGGSAPSTPRVGTSARLEDGTERLRSRVSMDAIHPARRPSTESPRYARSVKEFESYQGSPRMPFGTPVFPPSRGDMDISAGPSRPRTPSVLDMVLRRASHGILDTAADDHDADDEDDEQHDSPQGVTWTSAPVMDGVLRSAPGVYGLGEGWAGGPQVKRRKRWFRRTKRAASAPNTEDPLALWQDNANGAPQVPERGTSLRAVWNRSKAAFASMPSLLSSTSPATEGEKTEKRRKRLSAMAGWSRSRLSLSRPIPEEDESRAPHYRKASDVRDAPVTPPTARRAKWAFPISPSMPHLGLRRVKDTRKANRMPVIPPRQGSLWDPEAAPPQPPAPTLPPAAPRTMSPIMAHYLANASAPALSGEGWKHTSLASAFGMPQVTEVDEPQRSLRPPPPPVSGVARQLEAEADEQEQDRMSIATFGAPPPPASAPSRPPLPRSGTFGARPPSDLHIPRYIPTAAPVDVMMEMEALHDSPSGSPAFQAETDGIAGVVTPLRNSVIGLDSLAALASGSTPAPAEGAPRKRPSLKVFKSAFSSLKNSLRSNSTRSASSDEPTASIPSISRNGSTRTPPHPASIAEEYDAPSYQISQAVVSEILETPPRATIPTKQEEKASRRKSLGMFSMPQGNASLAWLKRLSRLTEEDDSLRTTPSAGAGPGPESPFGTSRSARRRSTSALPLPLDPFHRIYASSPNGFKSMTALNEVDLGVGNFEIEDILDPRRRRAIVKRLSHDGPSSPSHEDNSLRARYRRDEIDVPQSTALHTRNISLPSSIANSTTSGSSVPMPRTPAVGRTVYIDGGVSGSSSEIIPIPKSLPHPPRPLSGIHKGLSNHHLKSAQSSSVSVISGQEVFRDAIEDTESLFEDALEDTVPSHAQKGTSKTASYVSLEFLASVV